MLFKLDKSKPLSIEDLGKELQSIDTREQAFFLNIEDKLSDYAAQCDKQKQVSIKTFKEKLEHERQLSLASKAQANETLKQKPLTQGQPEKNSTIFEKLQEPEDAAMARKYEQFVKQLEGKIEEEKQKFLAEQQDIFDKKIAKNALKREDIKNNLRQLVLTDQASKIAEFKSELNNTVQQLSDEMNRSVALVNQDDSKALDEYKRINIYLYNTLNHLAQKHLCCMRDELKLSLAVKLSQLTKYNLNESLELAERVVTSLTIQITSKDKNKISFELIAKDIEKELGLSPEENNFEKILLTIKQECFIFTARTEYLFTSYFDAQKREYGNRINSTASDTLISQDNACRLLQEQVLNYMLNRVNPNEFHAIFVNLGMEELQARMHNQSTVAFERHRVGVLEQLSNRLNALYDNFFVEKGICPAVKEKLNRAEVQKFFYERITQKYMKHKQDDAYYLGQKKLSSTQVLDEFEADFEKQLAILPTFVEQADKQEMTTCVM
ncbi:Uncharacterised protein [Legionella beliardensis]|uniref:Uncharacterized protein n=1 Tax=Legionella beliardensis TaxID=91822 RepID=A0A378I441_9GAMM|nr:hypothetical protein [Legionella beliardensis]STX29763.1 Uncharacterised protein [Legionella beliardensis]